MRQSVVDRARAARDGRRFALTRMYGESSFGVLHAAILTTIMLALVLVIASMSLTTMISRTNAKLDESADRIRMHISLAHLWLEEVVAGDQTVGLRQEVVRNLDAALEGCRSTARGQDFYALHTQVDSLAVHEVRNNFVALCEQIKRLRQLSMQRLADPATAKAGTPREVTYDAQFCAVIQYTDGSDRAVSAFIMRDQRFITWINDASVLLLGLLFVGIHTFALRTGRTITARKASHGRKRL
jgi:hypothetical protein